MTFTQLASRSLRILGAIDPSETITATELANAMIACNAMLRSWAARDILVYATTQTTYALPASTVSVTIGAAGDVVLARPSGIDHAWLRISNQDYTLEEITLREYDAWVNKTTSGIPEEFALRDGYPNMTMYFKNLPSTASTLYLETRQPFTEFTTGAQTVLLPDEYEEAIVYNLAFRLAPEYQKSMSQEAQVSASTSLRTIKNKNAHPVRRLNAIPFSRNRYFDINRGY